MTPSTITLFEVQEKIKSGLYIEASPINALKKDIYAFAEDFSMQLRDAFGEFNLWAIIEKLNGCIRIIDAAYWGQVSGSIFVDSRDNFEIILPSYTSPVRDNFTIAHEVGHFLLHSEAGAKKIWAHRLGSGRLEWEANWFAASLLMPKRIIEQNNLFSQTPSTLANFFQVSYEAAEIRLTNNGI